MPDRGRIYNVLFLCTGNSARSIMAESICNTNHPDRLRGYSAGSQPKPEIHPRTLAILGRLGHDVSKLRSKGWEAFAEPGAPEMDFVFTVCDDAAGETCPVWPGQPITAHWGVPDPARAEGTPAEIGLAFDRAYSILNRRIDLFTSLSIASLDSIALKRHVDEIGRARDDARERG